MPHRPMITRVVLENYKSIAYSISWMRCNSWLTQCRCPSETCLSDALALKQS
jgi:hypothetical protein